MIIETIFSNLLYNGTYFVQVWPHLKESYFDDSAKKLYGLMKDHVDEYNSIPSKAALEIALSKQSISDVVMKDTKELINNLSNAPEDLSWLVKETESYCREKAMYNATSRAIEIQVNASKPEKERDKKMPELGAITEIMQEALSVSFDASIGHDYFEDWEKRWLLYQSKAQKIPFKIPILNTITKGGAERGTLNLILSGVNVGKSLGMCSLAADYLADGYNVLYISLEMAEHVCAKRVDANLLDVSLDDIDNKNIQYADFKARMEKLKASKVGKFVIKQYPTAGAGANHFRALLKDLKLKKNFKPDVIMVDYLGIAQSTRIKGGAENSYTLVKAIAEELRGLAVEEDAVMWSGAQTTRGAWDSSDVSMSDIAESAGLAATADFILAGIETEELADMGLQLFKQIKSRYGDKNIFNHFKLEVRKGNQRWMNCDNSDIGYSETFNKHPKTVEETQQPMLQQFESSKAKLNALAKDLDIQF
ncbi:replication and recombination DNA helicase [Pectobacterium phage POP12]|nr:replication and recombination DNA helicase [Pectobacterium phage POP12]